MSMSRDDADAVAGWLRETPEWVLRPEADPEPAHPYLSGLVDDFGDCVFRIDQETGEILDLDGYVATINRKGA